MRRRRGSRPGPMAGWSVGRSVTEHFRSHEQCEVKWNSNLMVHNIRNARFRLFRVRPNPSYLWYAIRAIYLSCNLVGRRHSSSRVTIPAHYVTDSLNLMDELIKFYWNSLPKYHPSSIRTIRRRTPEFLRNRNAKHLFCRNCLRVRVFERISICPISNS